MGKTRPVSTRALPSTWRPAVRAAKTSPGSSRRWPVNSPGPRAVLAFDLYGTLVDPVAIAAEIGRFLGAAEAREAARLWRLKQLEYSFRLTAMGLYEDFRWVTSRALDFTLASLGVRVPSEQAQRLAGLYAPLQPSPDAVPALRALAGMGYELVGLSNGTPAMI